MYILIVTNHFKSSVLGSLHIFALKYCNFPLFFYQEIIVRPPPPRERRNKGIALSGRPSIYLQIRVRPITYFCSTFAFYVWHMDVSPRDDVSRTFMILIRLWHQDQCIGFLTCLRVQTTAFLSFDTVISYMAHDCIDSHNFMTSVRL